MERRTLLTAAGAAAAASTFPAPAIAQGVRELKLVSSLPDRENEVIARNITEASCGRLRVKAYAVGELVDAFEVFDAVSEGIADMYRSTEYYWQDRSPAFAFFTAVPFGLTAAETYAWIRLGGGQELWDELSANFNLKPFPAGSGGIQMGGWYKEEVSSIESFRGLRLRMPGLGGEAMRRVGAIVVNLPAGEIVPALKSGALDAAEWVGPEDDMLLGFHTAAKYYYYPGFHEPGTTNSLAVNKKVWESLSREEQRAIETVSVNRNGDLGADARVAHMKALVVLVKEHEVQLRRFNDEVLRAFGKASGEVLAEIGNSDPFTRRVYESYMNFRGASIRWTDISERAYLNARALDFPYGS